MKLIVYHFHFLNQLKCNSYVNDEYHYYCSHFIKPLSLLSVCINLFMIKSTKVQYHIYHDNDTGRYSDQNMNSWRTPLIARSMGPTWGPSGADRTQVGPCWPHKLCHLALLTYPHRWAVQTLLWLECIQHLGAFFPSNSEKKPIALP